MAQRVIDQGDFGVQLAMKRFEVVMNQLREENQSLKIECKQAKNQLKTHKLEHASLINNIDIKEQLHELQSAFAEQLCRKDIQVENVLLENEQLKQERDFYLSQLSLIQSDKDGLNYRAKSSIEQIKTDQFYETPPKTNQLEEVKESQNNIAQIRPYELPDEQNTTIGSYRGTQQIYNGNIDSNPFNLENAENAIEEEKTEDINFDTQIDQSNESSPQTSSGRHQLLEKSD
ncbi:hypothetical protein FGO68_gene1632 [Halteria grandinella]|uniref:Uncharacterized protein n=1 Tax=Halteria grandinella TaxID=5974 RepID=A0A8J8T3A1_HALGN|nr:hypothetical protein FGO68_gene1632 [Halteria grandinella]